MMALSMMMDTKGFEAESSFSALVFFSWIVFLYTLLLIPLHLFDAHSRAMWLYKLELGLDAILTFICLIVAIVVASKCAEDMPDGQTYCSDLRDAKASNAFLFLTTFALFGSSLYSFQRFRNPPRGGYGTVG
jgi:hypothetical protein